MTTTELPEVLVPAQDPGDLRPLPPTAALGTIPVVGRRTSSSGHARGAVRLDRSVSVSRLVLRFALAGMPVLVAAIVVTAVASVRIGTQLGIDDARRINWVSSTVVEEQGLSDGLLVGDDAAVAKVNDVVNRYVVRGSLVRVKIWDRDGTILYSNEPRLIGMRFGLDADELDVLEGRAPAAAEASDLSKPENRFEDDERLLEVYQAISTPNGTPLLFEGYFHYDDVATTGRNLWRQFAPIAVGVLLVLQMVQIPFAWSMARRLRSGQQQRERLLQHAIDSSDAERRRIASDLHDGVVQDLTGVSLSLAAAGRNNPDPLTGELLGDAGGQIRETVKSLRSLLVDIYPPNLYEEGLENALADLLAGLHNRNVATTLDVDAEATNLPAESVSLLYRCAQEALRNVANHADARNVDVQVRCYPGVVTLIIEDDGRGFDQEELLNRVKRGHVGLKSLAGLIGDAGGQLELRSQADHGTYLEASLPR